MTFSFFLQEEQVSVREIKWDAYKKFSEDQLEAEQQHVAELEVQVSSLKQQLQEAEIHYKHKVGLLFECYILFQFLRVTWLLLADCQGFIGIYSESAVLHFSFKIDLS